MDFSDFNSFLNLKTLSFKTYFYSPAVGTTKWSIGNSTMSIVVAMNWSRASNVDITLANFHSISNQTFSTPSLCSFDVCLNSECLSLGPPHSWSLSKRLNYGRINDWLIKYFNDEERNDFFATAELQLLDGKLSSTSQGCQWDVAVRDREETDTFLSPRQDGDRDLPKFARDRAFDVGSEVENETFKTET